MGLFVFKFGGTSVASVEHISHVASIIAEHHNKGHKIVVVVSAMGGDTDRLVDLASAISVNPAAREMDMLLSSGEQVSMSLLAMALLEQGVPASSFLGSQIPIITDSSHTKARIKHVETDKIKQSLEKGEVVVIAGFQGCTEDGEVMTLGRGGSDTTAVAVAAALKAQECRIYTDVDGVYTTDPRVVSNARCMKKVTFEEMLELSSLGAKVLQIRSVELAGRYNVPLRVLSTFKPGEGTLITYEGKDMENHIVSGVAFSRDEARVVVLGAPDIPGLAGKILSAISSDNIEVDMIIQDIAEDGTTDFAFTVCRGDLSRAVAIMEPLITKINAKALAIDDKIAKLSLVGVGMRSHAGIASRMFSALGREGVNIQSISTSEIKVSVLIEEKYLELGVRALHDEFELAHERLEASTA